jgi:hypothetical protein
MIILSFCEKTYNIVEVEEANKSTYVDLEARIRKEYDYMANFTWDQYLELLTALSDSKFIVLPLNEMRNTYSNSSVVVGLRHDIDLNPFKALEMAKIEMRYGFRATYFILATSDYYGTINDSQIIRNPGTDSLYKELHNTGAEIGIHNDLISIMILNNWDPFKFNKEELRYYKSLHIPIHGTASHGGYINRELGVSNYEIFSDFAKSDTVSYMGKIYPLGQHSLSEFRFSYEAYHINFNKYFSESGGIWNDNEGFKGVLEKIRTSVPGDRIQILTHPERWGEKNDTIIKTSIPARIDSVSNDNSGQYIQD